MDRTKALMNAIDRLYASVTRPAEWSLAVRAISELLRAEHAGILVDGTASGEDAFLGSYQIDASSRLRLLSPEGWPLVQAYWNRIPIGKVTTRAAIISDEDFVRSEIYNEIVRPMNGFHYVYARQAGQSTSFAFGAGRPAKADGFGPPEMATLRSLSPHLTTAVLLHRRLQMAEHGYAGLARVLDRLKVGVILTDASARPCYANARATQIIADSGALKVDDTGLAAATPLATRQLHSAILKVSRDATVTGRRLRLERPSHPLPLLLSLVPVFRLDLIVPGVRLLRVAVFIKEPDVAPQVDRDAIADIFHLTRRETDVAILLARGLRPDEIAARCGVGVATVRHHLKHIFQKSGAHSQTSLVALIRGFDLLAN
jgi:DNA-binding CsgD family transcriptional regulator/PAS domain-containing protein